MKFTTKTTLQLATMSVATATVAATIVMILHPNCLATTLFEVCKGVAGGAIISGLKIHARSNGLQYQSIFFVCKLWRRFSIQEMRFGLVVGYMLGLMHAIWTCLIG